MEGADTVLVVALQEFVVGDVALLGDEVLYWRVVQCDYQGGFRELTLYAFSQLAAPLSHEDEQLDGADGDLLEQCSSRYLILHGLPLALEVQEHLPTGSLAHVEVQQQYGAPRVDDLLEVLC